ncbi:flavin monoamine oxidase family protein [Actinopolyspora mortivallis]|uniref:Amine oxidase n=1 Tax=Actinopolyspora mortivallis TaxID=33906 RepID=A0A2T0GYZ4_ACTMO|nr:NAD(P)/FAD-dependent oxidoreductase [Actinopolyspora mortivallis]PRW64253.1 amine oxidase [Actinopolyspora mortivallis]
MSNENVVGEPVRPRAVVGGTRRKVTVLGAGIAGLVAAYELERLGHDVEILEADTRPGGRIRTHRFGTGPDAPYVELGAMRVPAEHHHTWHYIRELGLTEHVRTFRTLLSQDDTYLATRSGHLRTKNASRVLVAEFSRKLGRSRYSDNTVLFGAWLAALSDAISPTGFRANLDESLHHELLDLVEETDLTPYLVGPAHDRIDLHAYFAENTHLRTSCSGRLARFLHDVINETSPDLVRLSGGMDQLVHRLVDRIRGPLTCGQQVVGIDQCDDHTVLRVRDGNTVGTRHCEYVLCTIPFSVLRHMPVSGFSADKRELIRQVRYWSATKVAVHCDEPFWERDGIVGGASFGGGRIRQVFYPAPDENRGDGAVLMASYTMGNDADVLGRMPREHRHAVVLEEAGRMHPELHRAGMVREVVSLAWGEHPFTNGAGVTRWGKDSEECEWERLLALRPQGRVFFAGEHCSSTPAWVNGAIESALRAVTAIDEHSDERTPTAAAPSRGPR